MPDRKPALTDAQRDAMLDAVMAHERAKYPDAELCMVVDDSRLIEAHRRMRDEIEAEPEL